MKEKQAWSINGFIGFLGLLVVIGLGLYLLFAEFYVLAVLCAVVAFILICSISIVQPNQALAITFFGQYMGTIRQS